MGRRDVGTVGNKRQVVPLRRKKPARKKPANFKHTTSRPIFLRKRKGRR